MTPDYTAGFDAALTLFWQGVCVEQAGVLAHNRAGIERHMYTERQWMAPRRRGFWEDKLDEYDRQIAKLLKLGGAA